MATDENWGRALRTAKRLYEQRHDTDLTYKGMGERLGVILGRDPIPHPTVRSWFVDGQEPDTFQMVRALATMLEVDVGSLLTPPAPDVARDNVNQSPAEPPSEAPKRKSPALDEIPELPYPLERAKRPPSAKRPTSEPKPARRRRA